MCATSNNLVKWRRLTPNSIPRIAQRLSEIRDHGPVNVPRLISYGFSGDLARLETERVPGTPLKTSRIAQDQLLQVLAALSSQVELWRRDGFVHGDLSPRNILVDASSGRPQLWFIDWIVDLEGFEATPLYASPEVMNGRRSHDSDCYAIERISCIFEA